MPQHTDSNTRVLWKQHIVLWGVLLLAACGGGGGGSAPTSITPGGPSGSPSSGPAPGNTNGGGTVTPPPASAPQRVGIVGCSVTLNAVDGYQILGGDVLWPSVTGYAGGTISAWALDLSTLSGYWSAFDAALAANPDTDAVWLQLCTNTSGASQDTFENAQIVADEIRRRAPGVRVFVSAQNSYSDGVCGIAGANGPANMQTIADQLVNAGAAEAGPTLGPLSMSQTVDTCHASADGAQVLGAQLAAFFGPELSPPPPPPPQAEACRALPLGDVTPLTAAASGTRVIEDGDLYGLYGIMVDQNDRQTVLGNANLFVLRGADTAEGTEIWIFGTTAGDPFSDFAACNDFNSDNIRSMAEDADDIRNIINACMGVPTARALIRHVTPHAHYDHINSDLFAGLVNAGFDAGKMVAYVHTDEYQRIFSANLCNNVPRVPEYPSAVIANAQPLGLSSDNTSCGRVLKTFPTQNLGDWSIVASHGHMENNTSYLNLRGGTGASQYHMTGAIVGDLCYDYDNREPAGYRILPIHSTIDFYW